MRAGIGSGTYARRRRAERLWGLVLLVLFAAVAAYIVAEELTTPPPDVWGVGEAAENARIEYEERGGLSAREYHDLMESEHYRGDLYQDSTGWHHGCEGVTK